MGKERRGKGGREDTRFLSFLGAKYMGGTTREGVCVAGDDAWANSWFLNAGIISLYSQKIFAINITRK